MTKTLNDLIDSIKEILEHDPEAGETNLWAASDAEGYRFPITQIELKGKRIILRGDEM